MKKLIILLSFSSFVFAQNSFNVNTQSVGVNSSFFVEIALDNTSEVTAFQFDISYNESAYELSNTSVLTSRAENHTLSVSTIDDNTIRVLVYSAANELISVGDGAVLNLSFNSKNQPATYNLNLSDIVLSDINGASLGVSSSNGSVTILGPRYNLVTSSVDFGEIPMESSPTQSVSVSNTGNQDLIISGHTLDTPFSINQSSPLTISPGNSSSFTISVDTSSKQVISKELSFTTNDQDALRALQTTTIQADIFAVNEIYIGSGLGESNTQITIPVSISNMEPFSGFQFDVTLPNDVSYVENSAVLTTRASDHNIAANMIDSNTLRFVSYSGSNADFLGNDGEVFSFKVIPNITSGTYTLPISNSIISNVELGDILSEAYNGSFTINAPYLSTSVQTINYGGVPITETRTTNITLTNTGSAELVIDELVFDASALSFPLTIPTTLAVGESTSVELIFDPIQNGSFNQNISLRNNSPEDQQIITVLAEVFSPNYLKIVDKDVLRNQTWAIELNLANNDDIRGIQFDVTLPEGFVLDTNNIVEESIIDNFSMSLSFQGNNTYRFVIYTVSNDYLIPGDETILQLPVFIENTVANGQYPFEFSNVVLSSSSNQNIVSEALSIGYVNVVETLSLNETQLNSIEIYPNPVSNILQIKSSNKIETIELYDYLGRKIISKEIFNQNATVNVSTLSAGIFILVIDKNHKFRIIKN